MPRFVRVLVLAAVSAAVLAAAVASAPDPAAAPAAPPPDEPRFWRGNLHTHSLWSDGDDFPEVIADWYKRNGYQFLALTEHNVIADGDKWVPAATTDVRKKAVAGYQARFGASWVEQREKAGKAEVRLKPLAEFRSLLEEPGKFLLVPGEEITHKYAKAPVHVNGINLRDPIRPSDGASVGETIRVNVGAVADARTRTGWKSVAVLNHPNFGWGVNGDDMLAADNLRFFEVWNGHPSVNNEGDATHASCERLWDFVNAVRLGKLDLPPVYGLATDDAHNYHAIAVGKANPGRGWVMVRARRLTAENVVAALEAGDFYASSGVTLTDVRRDGDTLKVLIRAESGVTYRTEFVATMKGAKLDGEPRLGPDGAPLPVTKVYSDEIGKVVATAEGPAAEYKLTGGELYVRAKVTSSKPHPNPYKAGDTEAAWTQPVRP